MSDCPNLESRYCTPKILWHQTDNAIFMKILLTDVDKYYIKVLPTTFVFKTVLKDIKYFIGIRLCGTVIAEKSSHERLGREVKVCLIKAHRFTDWPRLQLSREKNPFIVANPDYIVKKSWDDPYAHVAERESFSDYKKRMNITNIMPPESESSNSDSDDEKLIGYDC